ncbi:MAG: helix-turn-helix domain-containing protein [Methylococcaceae bacterium]|nr:helix-turn-helix domain-containing protein [Methylococcaceae bacterium]
MARKKIDFTLDDVVEEIVGQLNELKEYIDECFGRNFYLSSLGQELSTETQILFDSEYASKSTIDSAPLIDEVKQAYRYVSGVMYGDVEAVETFLCGMGSFRVLISGFITQLDSKYLFLHSLACARWTLDNGDCLSIKEMALLAGVDERTIRNAASSKEDNKLITKKSGSSTIIENEEAIRWLDSRPDFKHTQFIADTKPDTPRYFEDEAGFGGFITFCMSNQKLTSEDVAGGLGLDTQVMVDLENGIDRLSITQVTKLAEILGENKSDFIKDYMRVFHLRELADLLDYEYKSNDSSNPEKMEWFKLMTLKQKLNLETQLRHY